MTTVSAAATQQIFGAGQSVVVFIGPTLGGFITNPVDSLDQAITPVGIPTLPPEPLYVSLTGPAALSPGGPNGTVVLYPGDTLVVPASTNSVWANALSAGHRFSAITYTANYPPTPYSGSYPPSGPTGMTATIPSYLYQQYQDDDDLQYFVQTYNEQTQSYVDWFNRINLPIYTQLSGYLLDWVGEGLYGIPRPTLFSYKSVRRGPFDTYQLNTQRMNATRLIGNSNVTVTTDDVYKRIITWHFYKGDGRNFNIRWLKRRILRFLYGTSGGDIPELPGVQPNATGGPDFSSDFGADFGPPQLRGGNGTDTTQISVEVGVNGALAITIVTGYRKLTGGALFNRFALNGPGARFDMVTTSVTSYTMPALAPTFKEAMDSGALEMPAQYTTTVHIGVL